MSNSPIFWFNTPPDIASTYEQRVSEFIALNQPFESEPDTPLVRHVWLTDSFDGPYVRLSRDLNGGYQAMYAPSPTWQEN